MALYALRNTVKHYSWGSRTALQQLLGEATPGTEPWAELWVGAHPRGSSEISIDGTWTPLREWIAASPERALGARVAARFGGELPFLLKVLAAAEPLSLQAHPDADAARSGWEREQASGIALDAPERSFPDPNPKPELVLALDHFEVLCGLRPLADVASGLHRLGAAGVADHFAPALRPNGGSALDLLRLWLQMPPARARNLTEEAADLAQRSANADAAWRWIPRLQESHPGDVGVLAPLLLEYRNLAPGEALFVAAGVLHGYLRGTALELQGSSDNVLRGALTGKHVDVDRLLRILKPGTIPRPIEPSAESAGGQSWRADTDRFRLRAERPCPGTPVACLADFGAEILLCTSGRAEVSDGEDTITLAPGRALFVPASSAGFSLRGAATVYRASAA
jgi:mannose-6-phosphate isomerase